ncbi:MAG: 4'-phosphopantetheinyl transferase [Bacteriovoracia bacterium]
MFYPPNSGKFHLSKLPLAPSTFERFKTWLPASSMSPARQQEFVAGRFCAVEAAKEMAVELTSLPRGPKREPLWPDNLVGSISHTKEFAVAWVDLKIETLSLGIDLEARISQERYQELIHQVANQRESELIHSNADPQLAFTMMFSAKEAFFKALYPLCHKYIGFHEVEWKGADGNRWEIYLNSSQSEIKSLNGTYRGEWQVSESLVLTMIRLTHKD